MIDTRFWLMSKVQLQFLAECEIDRNELVSISFGVSSGGVCLLTASGFIRLGKKFGIAKATHFQGVREQPRFRFNNVEFSCVCTNEELEYVAAAFELECSHAYLMEAGVERALQ